MTDGMFMINDERRYQVIGKGYDLGFIKAHPEYYANGQLANAAVFVLTHNPAYAPEGWPEEDIEALQCYEPLRALQVAGAFCAAEIDRLKSLEDA